MNRTLASIFLALILLSSAEACMTAQPHTALALGPVPEVDLTGPVYDLPSPPPTLNSALASLVNGLTSVTHHTLHAAADLPRHASHAPRLILGTYHKGGEAAGHTAEQAKQTATEGMNGFQTVTSFFLRIAYSSFSALISGILRS